MVRVKELEYEELILVFVSLIGRVYKTVYSTYPTPFMAFVMTATVTGNYSHLLLTTQCLRIIVIKCSWNSNQKI